MKRYWQDNSLWIVLGALWLSNWIAYAVVLALSPEGFEWLTFWEGTFENSTSEFLQLFTFVVLTKYLRFRGSHESKRVETPNQEHDS